MLYKYMKNGEIFVVISLRPEVLWEKNCLFCFTNASSNKITKLGGDEALTGLEAIEQMFAENRLY